MFHATNYTVSILLLMVLTVFMAFVRARSPLESNWLLFYWALIAVISFRYPQETFRPEIILVGVATGLLLRFEFINEAFARFFRFIELLIFGYIIYTGFLIITA